MKINVVLFWVILLLLSKSAVSQTDVLYTSLEQTKNVNSNEVYRLDLSKQKLTEFPLDILTFTNLKELYLGKNKFTNIPLGLKKLVNLEVLDLSRNKINYFPIGLCSMPKLKQLFLGKNNITTIPDCIGQMTSLEILDIWYNPLEGLPNTISNLKNLKNIDMRGINFNVNMQEHIKNLIPWAKVEFDLGCNCGK